MPLIILQGTAVFLPVVLRRKTGDPLKHLTEGLHIVIAHIIHEIVNAVRFSFQRFLGRFYLYPLQGGEPTALPGLTAEDRAARFAKDGRSLYVYNLSEIPLRVFRYEIATGRKEPWRELRPADSAGLSAMSRFVPTPDGLAYVYGYLRDLSYLQIVDGLK